jgi:protoporphyrinogen oxidase
MNQRVVIIGAGAAGLTAAYELQKHKDVEITVLEATEHLGGIATTAQYHGNRMDMGGHRFFTKSETVMNLWQELLPLQGAPSRDEILLHDVDKNYEGTPGADPEKIDGVLLKRRRVSRIYYLKHFFSYPISVTWATFKNLGLSRLWIIGWSYLHALFFKREEKSLEDFYINRFGKELYNMFFENYTQKIWGVHPSKISPDWGAQRVKGLSILGILYSIAKKPFTDSQHVETSLIEEYYYPKFGPGQMWEELAQRITTAGGTILTGKTVTKINKNANGTFTVLTQADAGKEESYTCDQIFSSMPLCDLVKVLPAVPQKVYDVAVNLPYRDFITVGLLVKKLLLKNDTVYKTVGNIVPDCWIYVQEHGVKLGRLQIFNNWSPYLVADLEHKVWIGLEYFCNEDDELWQMDKAAFIKMAIKELTSIGIIQQEDVVDATEIKVKKAYPAYFGSYKDISIVEDYLNSLEGLFCIGRNGQHKYNNMDHSMLTAIEAVRALYGQSSKENVWKVNTEHEYHEEVNNKSKD